MRLSKCAHTLFAASAAIALTAGLGGSPALASARTWTVTPGGSYTGTLFANNLSVFDSHTGQTASCGPGTSTAHLQFKSGSGLSNPIGKFAAVSFTMCSSSTSFSFTVTAGGLPWQIRATSYTPTNDVVHGKYLHLHLAISGTYCSAVIDGTGPAAHNGTVPFEWSGNELQTRFKNGGNLHVYNVNGCNGNFNDGDPVVLYTSYLISQPLTITSP